MLERLRIACPGHRSHVLLVSHVAEAVRSHAERCCEYPRGVSSVRCPELCTVGSESAVMPSTCYQTMVVINFGPDVMCWGAGRVRSCRRLTTVVAVELVLANVLAVNPFKHTV